MEFFRNPNIDWLGKKWIFIGISFLLSFAGLVSLLAKHGPRYGIDFKGGTLVHVKFRETPDLNRLRRALETGGLQNVTLQTYGVVGGNEILVGLDIGSTSEKDLEAGKQQIVNSLRKEYGASEKPNLNEASVAAIADQLAAEDQLRSAAVTSDQLHQLAQRIAEFRDTPPRRDRKSVV